MELSGITPLRTIKHVCACRIRTNQLVEEGGGMQLCFGKKKDLEEMFTARGVVAYFSILK